jgi:hypothetical protein
MLAAGIGGIGIVGTVIAVIHCGRPFRETLNLQGDPAELKTR